jgi:hypothetical protein
LRARLSNFADATERKRSATGFEENSSIEVMQFPSLIF